MVVVLVLGVVPGVGGVSGEGVGGASGEGVGGVSGVDVGGVSGVDVDVVPGVGVGVEIEDDVIATVVELVPDFNSVSLSCECSPLW